MIFFSEAVFSYQSIMEMVPDLQIEPPPITHEYGRVEIECGIRKERSHNMKSQWKNDIVCFDKFMKGCFRRHRTLGQ